MTGSQRQQETRPAGSGRRGRRRREHWPGPSTELHAPRWQRSGRASLGDFYLLNSFIYHLYGKVPQFFISNPAVSFECQTCLSSYLLKCSTWISRYHKYISILMHHNYLFYYWWTFGLFIVFSIFFFFMKICCFPTFPIAMNSTTVNQASNLGIILYHYILPTHIVSPPSPIHHLLSHSS